MSSDKRYIFCAKVDEFGGGTPAIDTSSFSLVEVTLLTAGPLESKVRFDDDATTWYENRFLLTAEQLQALRVPTP